MSTTLCTNPRLNGMVISKQAYTTEQLQLPLLAPLPHMVMGNTMETAFPILGYSTQPQVWPRSYVIVQLMDLARSKAGSEEAFALEMQARYIYRQAASHYWVTAL